MWTTDAIDAMEKFREICGTSVLLYSVESTFDGIVIKTTTHETYKYSPLNKSLYKIGNWKEG